MAAPVRKPAKKKFFVRRKRVCKFTVEKIGYIDFKDVKLRAGFVPERAKILPRRIRGTSAFYQRKLATALTRARYLALLPYVAESASLSRPRGGARGGVDRGGAALRPRSGAACGRAPGPRSP